jgi:uncharacterized protein (TIGR03067 family)
MGEIRRNVGVPLLWIALTWMVGCGPARDTGSPSSNDVPNVKNVAPPVSTKVEAKIVAEELGRLEGTWAYELQVVEGREIAIEGEPIIIRGDELIRTMRGNRPPLKSKIVIDPTTSPKQIDDNLVLPVGSKRRTGIYELDGDRLKLCYDNRYEQRPTRFESKPDTSMVLTVLKRQAAK